MRKSTIVKGIAAEAFVNPVSAHMRSISYFQKPLSSPAKVKKATIYGSGTAAPANRAAPIGTNPATGDSIEIRALKSVSFKDSRTLKDAVS